MPASIPNKHGGIFASLVLIRLRPSFSRKTIVPRSSSPTKMQRVLACINANCAGDYSVRLLRHGHAPRASEPPSKTVRGESMAGPSHSETDCNGWSRDVQILGIPSHRLTFIEHHRQEDHGKWQGNWPVAQIAKRCERRQKGLDGPPVAGRYRFRLLHRTFLAINAGVFSFGGHSPKSPTRRLLLRQKHSNFVPSLLICQRD
jgi:hypothetical protein